MVCVLLCINMTTKTIEWYTCYDFKKYYRGALCNTYFTHIHLIHHIQHIKHMQHIQHIQRIQQIQHILHILHIHLGDTNHTELQWDSFYSTVQVDLVYDTNYTELLLYVRRVAWRVNYQNKHVPPWKVLLMRMRLQMFPFLILPQLRNM